MSEIKQSWSNEADVLASFDQVSIFSKGQPKLAKMKIPSARCEDKLRYREAKRMELEILEKEKERQQREKEKLREDRMLEKEWQNNEGLGNQVPLLAGGRGRARMIQDIRKKVVGSSANQTETYIREQVRKTAGYYGNDMIEKYWGNSEGTEESSSKDSSSLNTSKASSSLSGSESEERWSPPVDNNQFEDEDASSLSATECVTNSNDYDIPSIQTKNPPRCRNALLNLWQKNSDLLSVEATTTNNNVSTEARSSRNNVSTEATSSRNNVSTEATTSRTNVAAEATSTKNDVSDEEEPRCVYTSSARTLCPSKFTFPSLYETTFRAQWASRNRKLKPSSYTSNEFIGSKEFKLNNDDFPPL